MAHQLKGAIMNTLYNKHPKQFLSSISSFIEAAYLYPLNYVEFKPKRENEIKKSCKNWDVPYDLRPFINQLKVSYLLGDSELIYKPYVIECASIIAISDAFKDVILAETKNCPEVAPYYKDLFKLYDRKAAISAMLVDLEYWGNSDKAATIANFNDLVAGIKAQHLLHIEKKNK